MDATTGFRSLCSVARQFMQALDALHGAYVVHNAVRPHSIVLCRVATALQVPKLRNFSAACVIGEERPETWTASLSPYSAPELWLAAASDSHVQATSEADMFSAGVVLAEMFSGASVQVRPGGRGGGGSTGGVFLAAWLHVRVRSL